MKKIMLLAFSASLVVIACNNDSTADENAYTDSMNNATEAMDNRDVNNRNVNVYDSTGKDTASYERMPNKINDSLPR